MTIAEKRRLLTYSDLPKEELLEIAGNNRSLIRLVNLRYPAPRSSYQEFVTLCHELKTLEKMLTQAVYTSEGSLADAIEMNGYETDTTVIRSRIAKKQEEIKEHPDYNPATVKRIVYEIGEWV